jgi:hypothetical protein
LRFRAAMVVSALVVIASSPGCGMDKSKEGPPFEPDNLDGPRSLLITNSDIEAVGASTPYAVVLRWWQALQHGEVRAVKRSYAGRMSSREAKREIDRFHPRFSQPVEPEVQTQGNRATVRTTVRAATRSAEAPSVVSINDFGATFALVREAGGWKLRDDSYSRYIERRRTSHPPPPSG